MEKTSTKIFLVLIVLTAVIAGFITMTNNIAKKMQSSLLQDTQILENYHNFQYTANKKNIASMPNEQAKKVPEIKKILDERDSLLAKIAPGCTLEYRAGRGITSAQFEPIKVHCDSSFWWRWLFL